MAWNPEPKVAAVRDYGKKFGRDMVIIIAIDEGGGQFDLVSYGKTKTLCAEAKSLSDKINDLAYLWWV